MRIPQRLEEIDPRWLAARLGHAVAGFDAEPVGAGKGFAGRLYRLRLRYAGEAPGAPATLIAKFAAEHAATRAMLDELGFYAKEARFYAELAPRVPLATPRCFFAGHDPATHGVVLLLEDLAPAAAVDLDEGLSAEQARQVLSQLARMHARFWDCGRELAWLAPDEALLDKLRRRYFAALPAFEAAFGGQFAYLVRVARQCGWLLEGDEFMRGVRKGPLVLTHGDLHLENLLFSGRGFTAVDWQSVMLTRHGAADVARVVGLGLRAGERRAHEGALLRHYHAALIAEGVRGYRMGALRRRYREELAGQALVAVVAFGNLDLDVPGAERIRRMFSERLEAALVDARVATLLFWMIALLRPLRLLGFGRTTKGSEQISRR